MRRLTPLIAALLGALALLAVPAAPAATDMTSAPVIKQRATGFGAILARRDHQVLYYWNVEKRAGGKIRCKGGCARAWPPLIVRSRAAVPRRILVLDDNVDSADSLALLLRLKGHEVEVAYDGPGALKTAGSFHPDVVMLDIGLPGLDGYQVASRLRRRRRTATALLLALTGYGREEDQLRSLEAGFDHHLTKPVDPQVLYDLIDLPR